MTVIHQRHCVRLQPSAHLNAQGAVELQQQVAAIASAKGETWLIDMAQVEFIDSAGILALVNTLKQAHHEGCRIAMCHLRPSIRLVFEITQLDRAFDIVDSSKLSVSGGAIAPEAIAA
jgi:anti-sigma B factor antagonist